MALRLSLSLRALALVDSPYRYSGSYTGNNCSGFSVRVTETCPPGPSPSIRAYRSAWQPLERDQLVAGDLMFFDTLRPSLSHVRISLATVASFTRRARGPGAGQADTHPYWRARYNAARRLGPVTPALVAELRSARPHPLRRSTPSRNAHYPLTGARVPAIDMDQQMQMRTICV